MQPLLVYRPVNATITAIFSGHRHPKYCLATIYSRQLMNEHHFVVYCEQSWTAVALNTVSLLLVTILLSHDISCDLLYTTV